MGAVLLAALLLLNGCVLAPKGSKQEQARIAQVGRPYEQPADKRVLAELPQPAEWRDVLQRAFLANGDLEARYFEWKAAMSRMGMAASWPNTNVQVGFDYMFSRERMKAWDRTTLSAGFDPSMPLQLPTKVRQAGKVALQDARVAGQRFQTAKFALQKQVLNSYLDLALMEEKLRIQRDNVALLRMLMDTTQGRVQAGGPQQDLLKAQIEYRLAENELQNMEAEARSMRAMLNGMLNRPAEVPLLLPVALPAPRPAAADDARLIAVAVDQNPELAGLAAQVQGRRDALELARMRYIPDFSPAASITGDISKAVGTMVMLPTNLPAIRGAVEESRAMLRSDEAMARQTRSDRAASFVSTLYLMRNAERQAQLFEQQVLPVARQALDSSRQAYSTGSVGFADLIDSQRTLLDVRRMIAEARLAREKRLADLEALAGVDVETLGTSGPATIPSNLSATHPAGGPDLRGNPQSTTRLSSPEPIRNPQSTEVR